MIPALVEKIVWLASSYLATAILSTLLLIVGAFFVRYLIARQIRGIAEAAPEMRRRWLIQLRQGTLLLILFGLLVIWGQELRIFAVSLFAIAAAIVIATKELIMCISGALLIASGKPFQVGDRIEIGGYRGDVFDHGWLTTTLLEIGPGNNLHQHTGRTLMLPNALFLTQVVRNETSTNEYVLHMMIIPMKQSDDWRSARERLLKIASEECAPFLADAQRQMERIGERESIKSLSVEPRISLQIPEPDRVNLVLRFPSPAVRRGRIEQRILDRWLEYPAAA